MPTVSFAFYLINGIVLLLLVAVSGLVSGSEVAFFSLSADQIAGCKKSSNRKENRISKLLLRPKRLLATILIINNLVNIFIITLSTYITWRVVGKEDENGIVILILTFCVSTVIIFFGEIIPKIYAKKNDLEFAKLMCGSLFFLCKVFAPLSFFLTGLGRIVEKRMQKKGYVLSVEQLNRALEISIEKQNSVSTEEKDILKGVVTFGTFSVKQVMRSRMDITAIDIDSDFHEVVDFVKKTGFSRIPVYRDTIDKIEGILYGKDLLEHIEKEKNFEWHKLIREPYFVPESKKIDDLFKDFQEKRVHISIVIDEYGGTSGLITMEDIIEEIVGEIIDENDEFELLHQKINETTYLFEGKVSLNDFCKIINYDPSLFSDVRGESESLGGMLLEINSSLPNMGEKIPYKDLVFMIMAVDSKRIKRVKVFTKNQKKNISSEN